ncbi:MAG: hypothetical protein LUH63_09530 [Parabacteroides sp.]|nr:hypothetical protein [Parabacteroides sp.]
MENKETLHRIAQYLMINSVALNNLGLFHGKMGVILFLHIMQNILE